MDTFAGRVDDVPRVGNDDVRSAIAAHDVLLAVPCEDAVIAAARANPFATGTAVDHVTTFSSEQRVSSVAAVEAVVVPDDPTSLSPSRGRRTGSA